jgi:hypothetical protein
MFETSTVPAIQLLYGDEETYYQQDGAHPHYNQDARAYLDDKFSRPVDRPKEKC